MKDWKHVHQRVEGHEKTNAQKLCRSLFLWESKSDIQNFLVHREMFANKELVRKRRQVLERVIEVIKIIGNTLNNSTVDHGNFLEMIITLSKYDFERTFK